MENLPAAVIVHRTKSRIRLRIAEKKRDGDYFSNVREEIRRQPGVDSVESNALTGSLLIQGKIIDPDALIQTAVKQELFQVRTTPVCAGPLAVEVRRPLGCVDRLLTGFSSGWADLPSLVFLGLLVHGIIEIARGNFQKPPWYTAFWYAFGVYSRSLTEQINVVPAHETQDPNLSNQTE